MQIIIQTAATLNEISSVTESFFHSFKLGSLLKRSGAYKEKIEAFVASLPVALKKRLDLSA